MKDSVMQQRIETFKAFGETLKGAKVYFREDWEVFTLICRARCLG